MRTWATLLSVVAVVPLSVGPAAAQKDAVDESLTCLSTQTSGSGEKLFSTCVTDTGSVLRFVTRQGGGNNINSDGYMICDSATGGPAAARAWSRGNSESNFAFPTTKTSTSNVRLTNDGRYRLTQAFARDATDKEMVITMTLKNLGPGQVTDVRLQRFVDIDADGSLNNIYVRGADSIMAVSGDGGRGMVVGVLTPEISHTTAVSRFEDFDDFEFDDCEVNAGWATPTADTDHVAYVRFNLGTIAAGAAKTVKIYYRKF